jgi:protein involved in polysaccharide export with SLBB domain
MRFLSPLCIALIVLSVVGQAQVKDDLNLPDLSTLKDLRGQQQKVTEMRPSVPLDAPVDPVEYVVGPGDVLALSIWSASPVDLQLTVTPEASLLIPNVGVVGANGLTLEQLKKKVAQVTSRKYINAEISLTLLTPRKVTVNINGFVLQEGKKEVYAVQRVDNLIALSNTFPSDRMTVDEYATELNRLRVVMSERRIVIRSRDGSTRRVDLAKYRATARGVDNPYLREGDNVYVPRRTSADNSLGVFGGMMSGASFEFVLGDSLSGLIAMALGFPENADPEHAILTRLSLNGQTMDTLLVDARAIAEHTIPDMALQPGDRLIIPQRQELRQNYRVTVEGAVARPGEYPITRGITRLSEVIRQAGGFLPGANLRAATLTRTRYHEASTRDELEQEQLLSRRASIAAQDTSYYMTETALRLRAEGVAANFYDLFVKGDSSQDVIIRPYDKIRVPSHEGTVLVFGQVASPGNVNFVAGKGYKYYIHEAGGFTNEAHEGEVKIIKAGSRTWLEPDETTVEDGDYVWVPKEVSTPFAQQIGTWAQVAAIFAALATVILVIRTK